LGRRGSVIPCFAGKGKFKKEGEKGPRDPTVLEGGTFDQYQSDQGNRGVINFGKLLTDSQLRKAREKTVKFEKSGLKRHPKWS